jgi:phosphopantetheine adenylyltransferase
MKKFRELMEKAGDTAVFTFGRFNPPTTGHEKLIEACGKQQGKNAGSKMYVYASQSNDPKKNPLPYAKKIAYMRKMYKKYAKNITTGKPRTAIEVAVELYNKGHKAIVMVVGSDRVSEFRDLLEEYNGVEGKRHGYYGFDNIEVVSAGERDPDAEGVSGMSASKMRQAASDGDFQSFEMGVPSSFAQRKELYRDVRKGMGIREERDMGDMSDREHLRDLYLTGKIWNSGDIIEAKGVTGHIIRKGTNYVSFADDDGKVHKCWIHEIELNEASALDKLKKFDKSRTGKSLLTRKVKSLFV